MTAPEAAEPETASQPATTWRGFLESVPPGTERPISGLFTYAEGVWKISTVDLQLHCEMCAGPRIYEQTSNAIKAYSATGITLNEFLVFACRNCQERQKTFGVRLVRNHSRGCDAVVVKFGEIPPFGPPLPSRLLTLLRDDADLLSKGRRSENQGMGIGAFGYYRRMVENQKGHLIDEIRKVAEKAGAEPEVLTLYRDAANQTMFTRAVEAIKDSIPRSLYIGDSNPLILLHDALSDGLHNLPDTECLGLAHDIRIVLAELVDRISRALKDEAELSNAIQNLARRHRSQSGSDAKGGAS